MSWRHWKQSTQMSLKVCSRACPSFYLSLHEDSGDQCCERPSPNLPCKYDYSIDISLSVHHSVLSREPPISFTIEVKTDEVVPSMIGDDTVGMDRLYVLLKFTLPENYPDELPKIEIESSENLDDSVLDGQ